MKTTKPLSLAEVPGTALEVWRGWVWVTGLSREHAWTLRRTREECEAVTLEVCQRLGVALAFDFDQEGDAIG